MKIQAERATFTSANIIRITAGTNCPQGGDSGHGGKTYIKIEDMASTDISVRSATSNSGCRYVEIILGGDTECSTFIDALKFAVEILEKQVQTNIDKANGIDYEHEKVEVDV